MGPGSTPASTARWRLTKSPWMTRSKSWASVPSPSAVDVDDRVDDLVEDVVGEVEPARDLRVLEVVPEPHDGHHLAGDVAVLAPAADLVVRHLRERGRERGGLGVLVDLALEAVGRHAAERVAAVGDRDRADRSPARAAGRDLRRRSAGRGGAAAAAPRRRRTPRRRGTARSVRASRAAGCSPSRHRRAAWGTPAAPRAARPRWRPAGPARRRSPAPPSARPPTRGRLGGLHRLLGVT